MTSLEFVQNSLKMDASAPHDDPAIQSQFDKIVALIEQEKISEAAGMIEKILNKGTADIRLIVYYFYAHFFNEGVRSFSEIFSTLILLLNERWDNLKPISRKDRHVQNSLNWFILNLVNKLKYFEKSAKAGKIHPVWLKSAIEISSPELEEVITHVTAFKDYFYEKWPKSPALERLMHLLQQMEDIKFMVSDEGKNGETVDEPVEEIAAPRVEVQPEIEEPVDDVQEESIEACDLEEEAFSEPSSEIQSLVASKDELGIITEKLRIFELLIRKNDYVKAALVAKDIDHLLDNFDPLNYFPKLFSSYFSLVARNVAALSEQWEKNESLQSKYLEKLYKTDINMFIEW